eukprot:2816356-Prymnesium_polylepis.1
MKRVAGSASVRKSSKVAYGRRAGPPAVALAVRACIHQRPTSRPSSSPSTLTTKQPMAYGL